MSHSILSLHLFLHFGDTQLFVPAKYALLIGSHASLLHNITYGVLIVSVLRLSCKPLQ